MIKKIKNRKIIKLLLKQKNYITIDSEKKDKKLDKCMSHINKTHLFIGLEIFM